MALKLVYLSIAFVLAGAMVPGWQSSEAKALLDGHKRALAEARSIAVSYSIQRVPAAPSEYKLFCSKPDKIRMETPEGVYVSDGQAIWEYTKRENVYVESSANESSVMLQAQAEDAWIWSAFFKSDPFKDAKNVALGAKRTIRGVATQEVNFNLTPERSITLYVDTKLGIARGALIKTPIGETLILVSEISISNEPIPNESFKFVPPEGAEKREKPRETEVRWADVAPIFNAKCTVCHGTSGGLTLTSHQEALKSRAIVPGDPGASALVSSVKWTGRIRMPQGGPKLPQEEIDLIEKWVAQGAK